MFLARTLIHSVSPPVLFSAVFCLGLAIYPVSDAVAIDCQDYWTPEYKCRMGCGPCGDNSSSQQSRPVYRGPSAAEIAAQQAAAARRQRENAATAENNQGLKAERNGNDSEALTHYERALELNPNDSVIRENVRTSKHNVKWGKARTQNDAGLAYDKQGDYRNAVACYEKALELLPDNSNIQLNLADAKRRLKDQQDNKIAANNMQQIVQDFAHNLNESTVPSGGLDFDGSGVKQNSAPLEFGDPNVVDLRGATKTAVDPTLMKGSDLTSQRNVGGASISSEPPSPITTATNAAKYSPPATLQEGQQRLAMLDKQIEQTKQQLRSLGFDQRSDDFERLGELSADQTKEIQKKILDLKVGLATGLGQDAILTTVEKLPPSCFGGVLRKLDQWGLKDKESFRPLVQALKDYAGNAKDTAPRRRLVEDAKVLVDWAQRSLDVKEAADKGETREAEKGLALMLFSVLTGKSVPDGMYDLGDTGLTYAIISHHQERLDEITNQQLTDLKTITARMKDTVDLRNRVRKDTQALQVSSH